MITLTPGDQGFEEATRLWNGLIDKTPALVVQPTGVADVVEAVGRAREAGLAVSVRAVVTTSPGRRSPTAA